MSAEADWQGIVVWFDGSRRAQEALQRGCELARERGELLYVEGTVPRLLSWLIALGAAYSQLLGPTREEVEAQLMKEIRTAVGELPRDVSVRWRIARRPHGVRSAFTASR